MSGVPLSVEDPLPTAVGTGGGDIVNPHLVQYNGQSGPLSFDDPAPTLTTHERLGLVLPVVNGKMLDIRFRMLQPHELAAAMCFPSSYRFEGNRSDVVRQIGNAVEVNVARALCASLLAPAPKFAE